MSFARFKQARHAAVAPLMAMLADAPALASQGPGGGLGTASAMTQQVMAIVVYGLASVILVAAAIRALKRRFYRSV